MTRRRSLVVTSDGGIGLPTAYSALTILFKELGGGKVPGLEGFVLVKEGELARLPDPARIVTVWDFYGACKEVLGLLRGGVWSCFACLRGWSWSYEC
jgi:hypothetical protein